MNFLAHIHLSHGLEPIIVGNLVADGYKGRRYQELGEELQKGVLLHRRIDDLTDHAAPTLELRKLLSPYMGRYAGVASDIYHDHFLALHWQKYHPQLLDDYVPTLYQVLRKYYPHINPQSRDFLNKMQEFGWLLAYRDLGKLDLIFRQMSRRTGVDVLAVGVQALEKHYAEVEQRFFDLYPLLLAETGAFLGLGKL